MPRFHAPLTRAFFGTFVPAVLITVAVTSQAFSQPGVREPAQARSVDDAGLGWGPCPYFFRTGCEIAPLHGDLAGPNADVYFRIPAHYEFPAHRHTSPERMVLVAGELRVNYDGQELVTLRPGMYAYGPANAVHTGRCLSSEPCVPFIAFEGPVDATPVDYSAP